MNGPVEVPEYPPTPLVTNPSVGILAVFLGAGLATLNSRFLSVGLPTVRYLFEGYLQYLANLEVSAVLWWILCKQVGHS